MTQNPNDAGLFVFQPDREESPTPSQAPSKPTNDLAAPAQADEWMTPTSLYEYTMGVKNIQATHTTYGEAEVFVTTPIHIRGNVLEVELDASEEHPVFDALSGELADKQTSVEYFVAYKQKPTLDDWVPLLPRDQETVRGERLLFQGKRARFLFPSVMASIVVYQNGVRLPRTDYAIINNQEVQIQDWRPGAIYTVDYTPDRYRRNPHVLELNDYKEHVERITEEFDQGTDINKSVHLRYTPFIDVERILQEDDYNPNTSAYRPIDVRLKDASIQGPQNTLRKLVEPYREGRTNEPYTYNKTLYLDKSWSDMRPYSLEEGYYGFDYYQHKNQLTFTEHFNVPRLEENIQDTHGNATIEVAYDALVTDFRLKIIVRRNTAAENTVTPKVNDYQLLFKTAD